MQGCLLADPTETFGVGTNALEDEDGAAIVEPKTWLILPPPRLSTDDSGVAPSWVEADIA